MTGPPALAIEKVDDGHVVTVDGERWLTVNHLAPEGVSFTLTAGAAGDGLAMATLEARVDLAFDAAGFAEPQVVGPWLRPVDGVAGSGLSTFGYQYMEFALPCAGAADGHGLAPWPLRPAAAMPIVWGRAGNGPVLLVGPLDHFHDQVIAVPSDERPRDGVACGWQGDLTAVPAGFATTTVLMTATSVREAIQSYGDLVRRTHRAAPLGRYADPAVSGVSYWTDNGAVYYYRPAPGLDIRDTLLTAVDTLEEQGLPIAAVQLDSWFYPRAIPREIAEGAPSVPVSGTTTWDGRADAFPDGLGAFTRSLGKPMVFHSRHLDATSPYFGPGGLDGWIDTATGQAHGAGDELFEIWMEQAASWGACTYEQDWLVEAFLTVRQLREAPGRAARWQRSMDDAAARRGLTLQWCMATPADFMGSVHLRRLSSIRTSMDFDYVVDRPANWGWFLHVNALARAFGLNTSKDVFLASRRDAGADGGGADGGGADGGGDGVDLGYDDPLAEAETLLAAMSCGPVGIGDRIGATDVDLVHRTCRPDGVLVMPDAPIAALSPSFFTAPLPDAGILVGESYTDHHAGRHHYLVAVAANGAGQAQGSTTTTAMLAELDHGTGAGERTEAATATWAAYRWVDGTVRAGLGIDDGIGLDTGHRHFDLWIVAPTLAGERLAVFGDVTRYASLGDRRVGSLREHADGTITMIVQGPPGELVAVTGWAVARPSTSAWLPTVETGADLRYSSDSGTWEATVAVGIDGWVRLLVTPG